MPAFSEPAGEEPPFTGTTTISFSNLGGVHKENASLAQHLEVKPCTCDPQQEEKQDRDGNTPDNFREDLKHELSTSEANDENTFPGVFSRHLPKDARADFREPVAVSVASLKPQILSSPWKMCVMGQGTEKQCVQWSVLRLVTKEHVLIP